MLFHFLNNHFVVDELNDTDQETNKLSLITQKVTIFSVLIIIRIIHLKLILDQIKSMYLFVLGYAVRKCNQGGIWGQINNINCIDMDVSDAVDQVN